MPICVVHIATNQIAKDIFFLNNLFYLQISVEPLKPPGPAQCFSCQRFGNGSRNCVHPPWCVKCTINHTSNVCPKTLEQSPTCCNCGGPCTANFRGCHLFLAQKHQVSQSPTQNSVKQYNQTQPFHHHLPLQNSTLTYSAATSNQSTFLQLLKSHNLTCQWYSACSPTYWLHYPTIKIRKHL